MTDDIDLPEDQIGSSGEAGPEPKPHSELSETMLLALESEAGLALEFASHSAAVSARFKFYNERNNLRKQGLAHFDSLVFTIEGKTLTITKFALPQVKVLLP